MATQGMVRAIVKVYLLWKVDVEINIIGIAILTFSLVQFIVDHATLAVVFHAKSAEDPVVSTEHIIYPRSQRPFSHPLLFVEQLPANRAVLAPIFRNRI